MKRGRMMTWTATFMIGALGLMPGVPAAAAESVTFKLPAHVIIETKELEDPGAPNRCGAAAFAEFPHIKGAVGYAVTLDDTDFNFDGTRAGPPFPDDDITIWKVEFSAPPGFHRFFLSGLNTPEGCAQAILGIEGRWVITKAVVSMSERFTDNWKKRANTCYFETLVPIDEPYVIGRRGGMIAVKAHGGNVYVTRSDGVRSRVYGQGFAEKGSVTIEVGDRSLARVGPFQPGDGPAGSAVVIAPGTKVRITPGKPVKVLDTTPGMGLRDVPENIRVKFMERNIRTNSCVLGGRG